MEKIGISVPQLSFDPRFSYITIRLEPHLARRRDTSLSILPILTSVENSCETTEKIQKNATQLGAVPSDRPTDDCRPTRRRANMVAVHAHDALTRANSNQLLALPILTRTFLRRHVRISDASEYRECL